MKYKSLFKMGRRAIGLVGHKSDIISKRKLYVVMLKQWLSGTAVRRDVNRRAKSWQAG